MIPMKPIEPAIHHIHRILEREFNKHHMPVVELVQAQTRSPFHVLVSTILSARTQDNTTAEASQRLFNTISVPGDLRKLSIREIEKLIFPVGFYHHKAKFLKELPDRLESLFRGKIPDTVEELVQLPGVGRKTANLVVSVGFNKPAICVDVHVHRIFNRLGFLKTSTPFDTGMTMRKILPVKYWITINSYLVSFGQNTCRPIHPHCHECPIARYCSQVGVKAGKQPADH